MNDTIWGIHAGKTGDAESLFRQKSVIALGWDEIPDLSNLEAGRDSFKTQVKSIYPDKTLNSIANNAGQLYRFVHEMKVGDLIVFSSKRNREVKIGEVDGDYFYDKSSQPGYPHRRSVKWLSSAPRTKFSQGALYELGSAMSFFQIKNYSDEFFAILRGEEIHVPVEEDESVGIVAEEIEDTTRDFILKTLSQELKGHGFARFVAHLMTRMGYNTRVSPEGPDGGVDIIAHRDELGFEPPIIKVQVKSNDGNIGDPVVSALYGKVDASEYGLLVTLGSYTRPARMFAMNKANLRLIDGEELVTLIYQYYEDFDTKYKSILPLKRVYVPQDVKEN
jgi:restriction system protein